MDRPGIVADNRASLTKDNIIYVDYGGPQNYDSIMATSKETQELAKQLQQRKLPVRLMTDISRVTKQTVGARQAGLEIVRQIHFDAIAVCGGAKFLKYLAIFFLRASGHPQAKYFDTVDQGLDWLRQLSPHAEHS